MPAINSERIENTHRTDNLLIDLEILRKEEVAQRRKVRIQQVRLQSKDISSKVLRDIRIEKDRQFKLNKAKDDDVFRKWQDKKISEVNLLYKENIDRLGEAYRNAEKEPDPEKEIEERSQKLTATAKGRGKKAMDRLRREQENAKIPKETLAARRENVRKVEHLRSALVSLLPTPGNNKEISNEPSDFEENAHGRSDNGMDIVENPRLHPKVPCLSLGSAGRPSKKVFVQSESAQNHRLPVAFTVDLYDRTNPCTFTRRLPNTVRVEKVSSDSWRNAAEAAAEEEMREMKKKQEKEREQKATEERGKKALSKEMIRRDFDQLMGRLDGLARKERVARGLMQPPLPVDMFMSDSRCASRAERRQRKLDSAFEGMLYSEDPLLDTQPSVERASVPEGWNPILSVTPPEVLNVGLQSKDTTSLSIDNVINEESPSKENISFEEASGNLSPSASLKSKIRGECSRTEPLMEEPQQDNDVPISFAARGKKSSRSEDVLDSFQEGVQVSKDCGSMRSREVVKVPDRVKIGDKDGPSNKKQDKELIRGTEMVTHTEDLTNKVESSSGNEKNEVLVGKEESDSSSQDASVRIEEVRVVLRYNESSFSEESGLSHSASSQKMEKVVVWENHKQITSDEVMKTVINLGNLKEGDKEFKLLTGGNSKKQKRRRKRFKEAVCKTEESKHVSPMKSVDPTIPSVEDDASERRAKALLKEVRAQRREIERLKAGPKTEPPVLGCYVRKLLSMTRESVEALSVSDVSTPSIHFDSHSKARLPAEEEIEESFVVEKVDKATSPVQGLSVDDTLPSDAAPKNLSLSSKSSSIKSSTASSTSISSLHDSVHEEAAAIPLSPHVLRKPSSPSFTRLSPLTPPPSPEYEQLADLHFRRINDLGTQLKIVRELQKKILSLDSSSVSEESSSSSVSPISSEKSPSSSSSLKSNEHLPLKVSEVGKNWNFEDLSLSTKEPFEDISLPEDLGKPLSLSEEVRRKPATRSGPPPTPLKGLKWSDFDIQIPHELSTITEVDSKLISALSVQESTKEKDLRTSICGAAEKLSIQPFKMSSTDHLKAVEQLKETSDSCSSPEEKVDHSGSELSLISSHCDNSFEHFPQSDVRTAEPEEGSPEANVIASESLDESLQTLDDVLRMLGISPTIFKRPDTPLENSERESPKKKALSPSNDSNGKSNALEENIMMQKDDSEQVSLLEKGVPSESFGRSPLGMSSHHLLHSTPLHSSSSGVTSSSSDSKQKSGFPFFGESAPSSICSNGTPQSGNWRNIDDSAAPKEG